MIYDQKIESKKVVFDADDNQYYRVFFEGSDYFVDINVHTYDDWLAITGNHE